MCQSTKNFNSKKQLQLEVAFLTFYATFVPVFIIKYFKSQITININLLF